MERGEDIHAGNDAHSELNAVEGNGKDISASDSAAAAAAAVTGNTRAAAAVREHDQYMPIANVVRIMRRILPPNAKISDDAKEKIQECVTEYISFVTGEANDRCRREQRKTVTADDILWAMGTLGFDDYVEPLTVFLNRYREIECGRPPARIVPQPQPAVLQPYMEPPAFHHMGPAGAFDGGFGGYDGVEWPASGGAAASSSSSDAAVFNNFDPYAQFRY